jgi:ABC-type Zn2+ transport system substrate-binding protein/surface adhesin
MVVGAPGGITSNGQNHQNHQKKHKNLMAGGAPGGPTSNSQNNENHTKTTKTTKPRESDGGNERMNLAFWVSPGAQKAIATHSLGRTLPFGFLPERTDM